MFSATPQGLTAELARMRMWRRLGDEREAELCNDRINDMLDMLVAVTTPEVVADSLDVNAVQR